MRRAERNKQSEGMGFARYRSGRPSPSGPRLDHRAPAPDSADTAERVGDEALVDASGNAHLSDDLLPAVNGALVDMLLNWLLCLHLDVPTNNVEGIADTSADNNGYLCHRKGEEEAHRAGVILPRAQSHDDVESSELEATVRNDSSERSAKTSVERKEALGTRSRLLQATRQSVKDLLSRADIGNKALTGIIQRIHERQTACCCQAPRCKSPQLALKMSIARRRFIFRTARRARSDT